MTRYDLTRRLVPAVLIAAATLAVGLTACGGTGPLAQPAPLFGAANKRDYEQQRAARAAAQNAPPRNETGSAEREANSLDDNAPLTTRDIQDPDSKLTTPRNSPVPGESNPLGPTVSTTPPN